MSFIRVKNIGKNGQNYRYAYLVENKWRKRIKCGKKGSRQKVSKYLGKVLKLERVSEIEFFDFLKVNDPTEYLKKTKVELIEDLINYELTNIGFKSQNGILKKENLLFNIKEKKFVGLKTKENRVVIEMNEGFFCSYTLRRLVNFRKDNSYVDEHLVGVELAKAFLEAGVRVPKEVFIEFFNKI